MPTAPASTCASAASPFRSYDVRADPAAGRCRPSATGPRRTEAWIASASAAASALSGSIPISGAKNAALPLMTAALLAEGPLVLENAPDLADIATMAALLTQHGLVVEHDRGGRRLILEGRGDQPRGALRHRAQDARLRPRARPAGGALRAKPRSRCRAAARSARAPSTCTSRASSRWAPPSRSTAATSRPRPRRGACAAPPSSSPRSASARPRTC